MKLYETLPDSVQVGRRRYRLDLDFRNVFRLMEVLERDDLLPESREYLALKCVMRRVPRHPAPVLDAIRALLFPERQKRTNEPRLTSFEQDADLIRAAFRQNYGIDLYRDKVHWIEFTALLGALPEGSRYAEVLGIRARPMPKPTKYNREEREWLMNAKARYALHLTGAEAEKSLQDGLRMVAQSLLTMIDSNAGGEDNG